MGVTVPIEEWRSLFDAVLAAPEDDAPRLALAQFLTDRGDARGESIRLACELEKLDPDDPERKELEQRIEKLPRMTFVEKFPDRMPMQLAWRRGFIEELHCTSAWFVNQADVIMRSAPIRIYDANPIDDAEALAKCPALAKLRRLQLPYAQAHRATILASPHLAGLRELSLGAWLDEDGTFEQLAADLRKLPGLRALQLDGSIPAKVCKELGKLAKEIGLRELAVYSPWVDLDVLRAELGVDRVMPQPEQRITFKFGVLDLSKADMKLAEFRKLAESGEYSSATKLVLNGNRIGNGAAAYLATSTAFPDLVELQLHATGLTDAGASALAGATHLEKLEVLVLGDVPAEASNIGATDGSGVSDAGVNALAHSERLPALRAIVRDKEYRHTYDGREERESIPIQRADGHVVESIIWHSIWP
jgi:uncharacterized protein (TIGR02996 family)